MGVHGLWRLLDTFGEVTQPSDWLDKRVAIDASIWINQFQAQCTLGENVEQRILKGFLLRILKLLFYGIHPVFVFDGPATSSKLAENRRRAEHRAALERSTLMRRAQQIVTAQLASGVLDVHALKQQSLGEAMSPQQRRSKETNGCGGVRGASPGSKPDAVSGLTDAAPLRLSWKRQRDIVVDPCNVSRNVTKSFLSEAAEWIAERKRGEMCVRANALAYFSTSLFMGPRHVVEEQVGVSISSGTLPPIANDAESCTCFSIMSSCGSSLVIDDECTSNESYEMVSSSASGGDSVILLHDTEETILSHIQEMEEVMSNSACDRSCESCFEEGVSNGNNSISSSSKDSTGGRSGIDTTNNSNNFTEFWNPGTQLICQGSSKEGTNDLEPYREKEEKSMLFGMFSLCSAEQQAGVKNDASAVEVQPNALGSSGPETGVPLCRSPMTTTMRQVIPFNLLGVVELLDCCGIPFVLSPREADAQCAFLSQHRLVDAVFTEDSDVIVHGATVVLRGFFSRGRHVVAYRQSDLLMCGVDKDVLVALALLLGCDYAEGVAGLSLLEALRVIAASWCQGDEEGPSHVLDMLKRWKAAVVQGRFVWDEVSTLQQFYMNCAKWRTLQVEADFPQARVVEAFFNPPVNAELKSFPAASPDWQRLRAFAGIHGLLDSVTCRQQMDLAQKELMARQLQRSEEKNRQQLRLTDFAVQSLKRERVLYKKQPPRFAAALSALREAKQSR